MYVSMYVLNVMTLKKVFTYLIKCKIKGALTWYGKLTWESAHALNLIILFYLIVSGMTFIFMVHLSFSERHK